MASPGRKWSYARSAGYALFVMALILAGVFVLVRSAGDPLDALLPDTATAEDRARFAQAIGLDKPIYVQFAIYVGRLLHGDFGTSLKYGEPAMSLVVERIPATVELGLAAMLVSIVVGAAIGIASAVNHGRRVDTILSVLVIAGKSVPSFFLGMLLIMVLAVSLGWFPVSGGGSLRNLVVPAVARGVGPGAPAARRVRAGGPATAEQASPRAAPARGPPRGTLAPTPGPGNALLPILTVVMLQIPHLMGGVLVIETLFSWPGMGQLAVSALSSRDMPLVQASVLFIAGLVVGTNLLTDILYARLDPRIRLA